MSPALAAGGRRTRQPRAIDLARALMSLGLACALGACVSADPPPALLTLPAPSGPSGPSGASAAPPATRLLSVKRVVIPEYLQARQVRYRIDDATLVSWPHIVWAERLEVSLTRSVVAALGQQLNGWTVCDGLCAGGGPQAQWVVELTQADWLRSTRTLRARWRWSLLAADGSRVLAQGQGQFDTALSADTPLAYAQALARLAERMAQSDVHAAAAHTLVDPSRP